MSFSIGLSDKFVVYAMIFCQLFLNNLWWMMFMKLPL